MPKLLVIDDEEALCYSFHYVLSGDDVEVRTACTAAEGLEAFRIDRVDAVVLDLQLPDRSGLEVFRDIRQADPRCPVIFITAHGTAETAIAAMKEGAFDYLVKPVDLEQFSELLGRAFAAARLMKAPTVLPAEGEGDRIVARSRVMHELCKAIGRIAPQDVNVLILGESGAGKELVARALYQHSRRPDRPFLAINCAAIPEALLESELFGHEKGAFTGADRRRIGKFEQADGGTLFLDEIGDMPPALQAKMLRVLQEQTFERLGSNETVQTQVRVLAATNQDLEVLVAGGRFRADLYYRLRGVTLRVPPLRERTEDIAELAHDFLFRHGREMGLDLRAFAPEALELLQNYPWPGNVRELRGVIQHALLNASGHVLLPEFLPEEVRRSPPAAGPSSRAAAGALESLVDSLVQGGRGNLYDEAVSALEQVLLPRVLQETQYHQGKAAEMLGISRNTLREKLRSLGLGVGRTVAEGGRDGEVAVGRE
jgi:two-component system nitrogen regulation response regulator GlnG